MLRKNNLWFAFSLSLLVFVEYGCESVTYSSPLLDVETSEMSMKYDQDLAECQRIAAREEWLPQTLTETAIGAVGGGVTGVILGALTGGSLGTDVLLGAIPGAGAGFVGGLAQHYRSQSQIVKNCLTLRGHRIVN